MLLPINIGGLLFLLPINNDKKKDEEEEMIENEDNGKIGIKEIIFYILLGIVIIGIMFLFILALIH